MTTTKNVFYAAVGAPVVAARRVADAVAELRSTLNKEADTLGKTANKRVALWADEGEKLVNRITDAKMVDELTSKVDFDQVSNQVSKLRDQLEEMLATWRASFRPEKGGAVTVPVSPAAMKLEAKAAGARARRSTLGDAESVPGARTPAPKPPAAKAHATKASAAKASAAKAPGAKIGPQKAGTKATASKAPAKSGAAKQASPRKPAARTGKKATSTARKSAAAAG